MQLLPRFKLKNKTIHIVLTLLLLFAFIFSSCKAKTDDNNTSPPGQEKGKLNVVTTILPIYDIAVNIGGDAVSVHNLLPPGGSPHTYDPTPEDSIKIESSKLIFKLGLALDDWLDKAVGKNQGQTIVVVSNNVKTLELPEQAGAEDKQNCQVGCDHEAGADPHIWMDPLRMKIMAKNVLDAYIKEMPDKADYFKANYEKYAASLDDLDRKYSEQLSKYKKKDFVTFHAFLNYQAQRYNLNQVAVIADFPGKEPDPHKIIEIIKILKEKNVKTVFAEPQFSPKASEAIAREIGGKVLIIDPMGSLEDPERNTYYKNMLKNLEVLSSAFEEENK